MVSSNDGFAIAEADLKLRGPGDMNGIRQSGVLDLKIADIAQDEQILKAARDEAFALIDADPKLAAPENRCIKTYLDAKVYAQNIWSMIS